MKKISSLIATAAIVAASVYGIAGIASAQTTAQPVDVVNPVVTTTTTTTTVGSSHLLSGQLDFGESSQDVTNLQTFLATNPTIYPEGLVTGYYGQLTENAVMRFQEAYGISPVGRVGPVTLTEINNLIAAGHGMTGANLNAITPITTSSSTGGTTTTTTVTTTSGIYPSTGLPAITNVMVQPYASSTAAYGSTGSAMISWNVNEPSQSTVFYLSALNSSSNPTLNESNMTTSTGYATNSQSSPILNLVPGNQYTFVIEAKDVYGRIGISAPSTFTVNQNGSVTSTITQSPSINPSL